jgi:hypothetical protein
VARGNIVLADHGITVTETIALAGPVPAESDFRLPLTHSPLTMEIGTPGTERRSLAGAASSAQPAVS